MTLFWCVIGFVLLQRVGELLLAKRNTRFIKKQGGVEAGENHYKWMVLLHVTFFISMFVEIGSKGWDHISFHLLPFLLFCLVQPLRIWSIASLGHYWNTRIYVIKGLEPVMRGPYKYIKHPNYLVVIVELVTLPMTFGAIWTAVLFSLLNVLMLSVRISIEEAALHEAYQYKRWMSDQQRFVPIWWRRK